MTKMEELPQIVWTIDAKEKFNKWRRAIILFSLPFYIASYPLFISSNYSHHYRVVYSTKQLIQIFMSGSILYIFILIVMLLILKFTFKNQKYVLSNDGFQKTNGKIIKQYLWSDFECFWPFYSGLTTGEIQNVAKNMGNITGDSIYLLKKRVNMFKKTVVTIDTLTENTTQVIDFISQKLPRNKGAVSEVGLIKYE